MIELTPPDELPLIEKKDAQGTVKIKPETIVSLNQQVDDFLKHLIQFDLHDQQFRKKVDGLHQLGAKSLKKTSVLSHRLLSRSIKKMDTDPESKKIGENLIQLRQTLEALNPANNTKFFAMRKFLNILPLGNKIEDYFDKYKSSEEHLNTILTSLESGKDELLKDNIAIDQDKIALWNTMQEIEQYTYIGQEIDQRLEQAIAEVTLVDEQKAKLLQEEVLFYIKQKVTDLMTQQAVNVQAYLSLDLIRKNNLELIKGVDRALMTTVAALQTAIVVAQALTNQKIVLNQVKMINSTTEELIISTSKMLNQQTREIQSQASSTVIDVEKLQSAFDRIFETIEMVNHFKTASLPNLQKNTEHLNIQLTRAQQFIDQVRKMEIDQQLQQHKLNEPVVEIESESSS